MTNTSVDSLGWLIARRAVPPSALLGGMLMGGVSQAATIYVTDGAVDNDPASGNCSLVEAIVSANTNAAVDQCVQGDGAGVDEIVLPAHSRFIFSNAYPTLADGPNALPSITSDVVIRANYSVIERSLVAGSDFRLIHVASTGDLTLRNAVLQNGRASGTNALTGSGGAIFSRAGRVVLEDSRLRYNYAKSRGGAISNQGTAAQTGSTILTNTEILRNRSVSYGGGVFHDAASSSNPLGTLTLTQSVIANNTSSSGGGGIRSFHTQTTLERCWIDGNTTGTGTAGVNNGGGVFVSLGSLGVYSSTISNNYAGRHGGGIFTSADPLLQTIQNTTVSGNTSGSLGGGVYNGGGATATSESQHTLNLINSTVTGNSATGSGSGIFQAAHPYASTRLTASVASANAINDDVHGTFESGGDNLIGGGTGDSPFSQLGDRRGIFDPQLGPLAANGGDVPTHAPVGSLLVDAVQGVCAGSDARGVARGVDGDSDGNADCDIGAVEYIPPIIVDAGAVQNVADDGICSLVEALENANGVLAKNADCMSGLDGGPDTIILSTNGAGGGGAFTFTAIHNVDLQGHGNALPPVTSPVTIRGNNATLTRSSAQSFRFLQVTASGALNLQDLSLANGSVAGTGGGIDNAGTLVLDSVSITGSTAAHGGGIYSSSGSTTLIRNSALSANRATGSGGAISGTNVTLQDSALRNNTASVSGGAAYFRHSTVDANVAVDTEISGNQSPYGAGLVNYGWALTLDGVTVSGNSAVRGGGVYSRPAAVAGNTGALQVTRSTLSSNTASQKGGAILNADGASLRVQSSTITGNTATTGAGVYAYGNTATLGFRNSILAGNAAGDDIASAGANSIVSGGDNMIGGGNAAASFSQPFDKAVGVVDPQLSPLQDNGGPTQTHLPLAGSPAVDGAVGSCTITDQHGMLRVYRRADGDNDGTASCDIGAVESFGHIGVDIFSVATNTGSVSAVTGDGKCGLPEAVGNANNTIDGVTFPECPPGNPGGGDTISLPIGVKFTFTQANSLVSGSNALPSITSPITIEGNVNRILSSGGQFRFAHVSAGGNLTLNNLQIEDFVLDSDGSTGAFGAVALTEGTLTVRNSTISGAIAPDGGALAVDGGVLYVEQSALRDNTAYATGGGVYVRNGSATISQSTLHGNHADVGGGVVAADSAATAVVVNSTLSSNSATTSGGAIHVAPGGEVSVTHATVTANSAPLGSGVSIDGSLQANPPNALFKASIVAGNAGNSDVRTGGAYFTLNSLNDNIVGGGNAGAQFDGANDATDISNPELGPLKNNGGLTLTHAPLATSAAVDGVTGTCPAPDVDQRGFVRPQDGDGVGAVLCDIGAVEVSTPIVVEIGYTVVIDGDGHCSLLEAFHNAEGALATFNDCTAGNAGGPDTIILPAGGDFVISEADNSADGANALPIVTQELTVLGNGSTIQRAEGAPSFRILNVSATGAATLNGVTLSNGHASGAATEIHGGGARVNSGGALHLVNSVISGSQADGNGGGIWSFGRVSMLNSTLHGNTATGINSFTGRGGGLSAGGGTLQIDRSTLSQNSAGYLGGGLDNGSYTAVISNSTVSGNTAADHAGGIFNSATLLVENSTVTTNEAPADQGSGIGTEGESWILTQVKASIVSGNANDDDVRLIFGANNSFTSLGDNLVGGGGVTALGAFVESGDNTSGAPALLGALADNGGATQTHLPQPSSPAIDAVTGVCPAPATDQRGEPRPYDGDENGSSICDIGAVEVGLNPNLDSDGDGMTDAYEDANGLDKGFDDSADDEDGDGLTNLEEFQLGTRADIADTDGDGIGDAYDLAPNGNSNHCAANGLGEAEFNQPVPNDSTAQCAAELSISVRAAGTIGTNASVTMIAPTIRFDRGFAVPTGSQLQVKAADPTPP